jgi:glycosyltransferase involved in cell wall biosynthesis
MKVIYPGVYIPPLSNRKTNPEKSVITYYGPLSKWRGVPELLHAFKKVVATHPNTELVLAGPRTTDSQRQRFEKTLQSTISPNIRVIGYVNDVYRELLEPSAVVCLPFNVVGVDPPLTILEAMAAGKPVISTNIQGIPEMLTNEKTGLLTEPSNVINLAGALNRLLDTPELGITLGKNAREHIKNVCNWTTITKEFDLIFQGVKQHFK